VREYEGRVVQSPKSDFKSEPLPGLKAGASGTQA